MTSPAARLDFADGAALAEAFADWTADRLRQAIEARGKALLVVSGGTTPRRYFSALSTRQLDWRRVFVTLADERRVPDDSARSNARMVRETLLLDRASAAQFTPLAYSQLSAEEELAAANARVAQLPLPADLAVLGMGDDGHTASWFPGAVGLLQLVDQEAKALVMAVSAPGAAEPRLTLSGRAILQAKALALHIEGGAKLAVFAEAMQPGDVADMPIRAVLRGAADRLTIFAAARIGAPADS